MSTEILFESNPHTKADEPCRASGWLHGRLSTNGQHTAYTLGRRKRSDRFDAVFCSDRAPASQISLIAFRGRGIPVHLDPRLRECDFGKLNGAPRELVHRQRHRRIWEPYPGGESWHQAVARASNFVDELCRNWSEARLLVIGHLATRFALEHYVTGASVEWLVHDDVPLGSTTGANKGVYHLPPNPVALSTAGSVLSEQTNDPLP